MKSIYLIIIALLLESCSQGKNDGINNDAYKTVTIEFANIQAQVPKVYVRSSIENYENKILESDREQFLKDLDLQSLNGLKDLPIATEVYLDSTNFLNQIYFQEGEYVKLTKPIAQQYLQMLKEHLEQSWTKLGLTYDLKEKKFFSNGDWQVIKIKYKIDFRSYQKYQTQYILSGRTKTIGLIISTVEDTDTDEIFGRIKI